MKDQIEALLILAKSLGPQILKSEFQKEEDEGKRAVLRALYQYVTDE
ncbi:hypothetical protein [Liquorilactobacillus sicerae]|nr:hypothetical protein [Liquorilactobacillus sicerae]